MQAREYALPYPFEAATVEARNEKNAVERCYGLAHRTHLPEEQKELPRERGNVKQAKSQMALFK